MINTTRIVILSKQLITFLFPKYFIVFQSDHLLLKPKNFHFINQVLFAIIYQIKLLNMVKNFMMAGLHISTMSLIVVFRVLVFIQDFDQLVIFFEKY